MQDDLKAMEQVDSILGSLDERTRTRWLRYFDDKYRKRATKPRLPFEFVKPTIEEVRAYCLERKNSVDPQKWWDYYTARGWKFKGGDPMTDWKAAVRTWEKNGVGNGTPAVTHKVVPSNEQVKAAGAIRTREQLAADLAAKSSVPLIKDLLRKP